LHNVNFGVDGGVKDMESEPQEEHADDRGASIDTDDADANDVTESDTDKGKESNVKRREGPDEMIIITTSYASSRDQGTTIETPKSAAGEIELTGIELGPTSSPRKTPVSPDASHTPDPSQPFATDGTPALHPGETPYLMDTAHQMEDVSHLITSFLRFLMRRQVRFKDCTLFEDHNQTRNRGALTTV
jgi:hypothetical protein